MAVCANNYVTYVI